MQSVNCRRPMDARTMLRQLMHLRRGNSAQSELQKVTAERDTLLDRLARAQAEFDNARKRAAREQQEYRDYALSDAIKSLLPAMDSFERALQTTSAEKNSGLNSEAVLSSFINSCKMRCRSWDCDQSRLKGSLSIHISMKPSKWWKPPTPTIRK